MLQEQLQPSKDDVQLPESPLFWPAKLKDGVLLVLDETQIPARLAYLEVRDLNDAVDVIRKMKTRAFGQFLVVLNSFLLELNLNQGLAAKELVRHLQKCAAALNNSRPTFPFSEVTSIVVNWGQAALQEKKDIKTFVERNIHGYLTGIRMRRLQRVRQIADLIQDGDRVLTHCNVSGELAMAAALCRQQDKDVRFFATETRPYLQGAKLTCWELQEMGADVTLISDSTVGSVMADGLVSKVIVGSDRNCANGDFANKIGTYQIAVLAEEFKIPFFVLTQPSAKLKTGEDIPIEIRNDQELLRFNGHSIVLGNVKGFYPGFDIVPNSLITGSIAINVN